jgi:hypothetical protein
MNIPNGLFRKISFGHGGRIAQKIVKLPGLFHNKPIMARLRLSFRRTVFRFIPGFNDLATCPIQFHASRNAVKIDSNDLVSC